MATGSSAANRGRRTRGLRSPSPGMHSCGSGLRAAAAWAGSPTGRTLAALATRRRGWWTPSQRWAASTPLSTPSSGDFRGAEIDKAPTLSGSRGKRSYQPKVGFRRSKPALSRSVEFRKYNWTTSRTTIDVETLNLSNGAHN